MAGGERVHREPAGRRNGAATGLRDANDPTGLRDANDLADPGRASAHASAYLLDVDHDLAEEFDSRLRLAVRPLTSVSVLESGAGPCALEPWLEAAGGGPGLLILNGLMAFETHVGDRTATELVGTGDLLQAPVRSADEMLTRSDSWRALWPTRFALLDSGFARRVHPWPQVIQALLRRAARRTLEVDALRAITCQPRLEVRLVLLLWHLAARWGRVEPGGIHLTLPLTHRLLGQLAAAERPSVSHALSRLAHAGLVTGSACDLHLRGTLARHLQRLGAREGSPGHWSVQQQFA